MEHKTGNISPEVELKREKYKEYILEQERKIIEEKYDIKVRENKEQAMKIEYLEKENNRLRKEIEQITNSRGYKILEKLRRKINKSKENENGKEKKDSNRL